MVLLLLVWKPWGKHLTNYFEEIMGRSFRFARWNHMMRYEQD